RAMMVNDVAAIAGTPDYIGTRSLTINIATDVPLELSSLNASAGGNVTITGGKIASEFTFAGTAESNLTITTPTVSEKITVAAAGAVNITKAAAVEITKAAAVTVKDATSVAVTDAASVAVTGTVATVTVDGTVPTVTANGGDVVVAAGADVTTVGGTAGTITTSVPVEITATEVAVVDVQTNVAVELTGTTVGTVTVAVADATISGSATVGVVEANAALTIDVPVGEVVVTADNVTVTLESSAVVDTVSVSEALAAVEIAAVSGATLETIKVTTAASGETATPTTEITVSGDDIAKKDGNKVEVEQEATATTTPNIADTTTGGTSVDTTVATVLADSMFTLSATDLATGNATTPTKGAITLTGTAGEVVDNVAIATNKADYYKFAINPVLAPNDATELKNMTLVDDSVVYVDASSDATALGTALTAVLTDAPTDGDTDVIYIATISNEGPTSKMYVLTIDYAKGAVTATLAGSNITGTAEEAMTAQDLTITLAGDTFQAMAADEDVTGWFNGANSDRPAGLEFKIKEAVAAGDTTATITVSGTPTAASTVNVTFSVSVADLVTGAADIVGTSTLKYAIAASQSGGDDNTGGQTDTALDTKKAAAVLAVADLVYATDASTIDVGTYFINLADESTIVTAINALPEGSDEGVASIALLTTLMEKVTAAATNNATTYGGVVTALAGISVTTTAVEGTKPVYTHAISVTADNISNSDADATFTAAAGSDNAKVEFIATGGSLDLTAALTSLTKTVDVATTTWTLANDTGLTVSDSGVGTKVTLTATGNTAVDVIETTLTVANAAGESIVVDIYVAGETATNEIKSVTFGTVTGFTVDNSAKTIAVVTTGGTVDMTTVVNVISTTTEISAYTDLVYAVTGRGITLDDNSKTEVTGRATADLIVAENTDSEAVTGTLTVSHDGAASVEYAITVAAAPAAVPTAPSATGGEGTITITADASAAWAAAKYEYTAESDFTDSTKVSTTSFDVATGGTITGLAADDYIVRVAADTATPQAWTAGTATGSIAVTEAPAGTQYAVTFVGTQTGVAGTLTAAKADGTSVTSGSDVDENTVLTFTFVAGTAPAATKVVKLGNVEANEATTGVDDTAGRTFTFNVTVAGAIDFTATTVTLADAYGVDVTDNNTAAGTVTDSTASSDGSYTTPVTVGTGTAKVTITLGEAVPTDKEVVVTYTITGGDETTGVIAAGDTTLVIEVPVESADGALAIASVEEVDVYGVTLTNTPNGTVASSTATDKTYTTAVAESSTTATVTITLAEEVPVGQAVTVTYEITGGSGEATGTIAAGETTLVIEVPVTAADVPLEIKTVVEAAATPVTP
ncbi:MAG: hypothetical protein R3Y53_05280, partial [Bacillota bacterium]